MMRLQGLACGALAVWAFGCGPGNRGDDDTLGALPARTGVDAPVTVKAQVLGVDRAGHSIGQAICPLLVIGDASIAIGPWFERGGSR